MAKKKIIDIGANLTDVMFDGVYFDKNYHLPDLNFVLERAWAFGIDKIIITGGTIEDSQKALELAKTHPNLYSTVGVHPTRCLELEKDTQSRIDQMIDICLNNKDKVVAVGEFGLDYDRINFCPKDIQLKNFCSQIEIAEKTKLPLFLHCRNSFVDLMNILKANRHNFNKGVVHSFDGTIEEAHEFINMGLHIGINGCSMKSEQNLEMIKMLPISKILIETDCPYCEIKPSHSSYQYVSTKYNCVKKEKWSKDEQVKSRNEPCNILQILEVISSLKDYELDQIADIIYENTMNVFFV